MGNDPSALCVYEDQIETKSSVDCFVYSLTEIIFCELSWLNVKEIV
jgi:hypothetical protein